MQKKDARKKNYINRDSREGPGINLTMIDLKYQEEKYNILLSSLLLLLLFIYFFKNENKK